MKLTAENVANLVRSSLFKEPEGVIPDQFRAECIARGKIVKGIVHNFCFDPERLAANKADIMDLLNQLPNAFHQSHGGGWSFLNACYDKDGWQWGEHANMEELFCLGMAVDAVRELMPDMRECFPGGMPYYVVNI